MYITIPQRNNLPETAIFAKTLKKYPEQNNFLDRNVMLLLHGGPGGNHTLYTDIEDALLEIADLVLVDLRGCGLSKQTSPEYCTLDNHIDDLYYILNALNISKPIIHGCSYGALVTLGFSIKYPDITSIQILSACVPSGDFIEKAKENLKTIGTIKQIQAADNLWNGTFKTQEEFLEYYSLLAPLYLFHHNKMLTLPTSSAKKIPYNIKLVNLAFTTFLRTFNFSDKLSTIKAPTLIFSGQNDWIFNVEDAEKLHNGIKGSVLIKLDQCGHFPWKDQRELFLQKVALFVNEKISSSIKCI